MPSGWITLAHRHRLHKPQRAKPYPVTGTPTSRSSTPSRALDRQAALGVEASQPARRPAQMRAQPGPGRFVSKEIRQWKKHAPSGAHPATEGRPSLASGPLQGTGAPWPLLSPAVGGTPPRQANPCHVASKMARRQWPPWAPWKPLQAAIVHPRTCTGVPTGEPDGGRSRNPGPSMIFLDIEATCAIVVRR